jgi:hypothetical protein
MPEYYIEFDERFWSKAARDKLGKKDVRERVEGYAPQLVQSFCSNDDLCTMTKIIIGGFHICVFFEITVGGKAGVRKWVLRVPILGEHGGDLVDEKFRSKEVL